MEQDWIRTTLTIDRVTLPVTFTRASRDQIALPLLRRLTDLQREAGRRIIVFLGAAPGAGKSVLLAWLEQLSRELPGLTPVQVLGLDGFHHTNEWLKTHETVYEGQTYNLRSVKGWPETFRPEDLAEKLRQMKVQKSVLCPVYDRNLHEPVEDRLAITEDIVLVEGMWMLYDQGPWAALQQEADYRILLLAKVPVLRERAVARKVRGGMTPEDARHFFDTTDCMAIRRILAHVAAPELVLESAADYRLISYGDACPDLALYLP